VATTGPNVRPGEKPPVRPELATRNSPAGAAEFARYWFAALDWGYATTDSTLAKSLYAHSCSECARFTGIFDLALQRNAYLVGGRLHVKTVRLTSSALRFGSSKTIDVTFAQDPVKEISSAGKVLVSDTGSRRTVYRTWLKRVAHGWIVVDLKQAVRK
jgi:hypothetical protein